MRLILRVAVVGLLGAVAGALAPTSPTAPPAAPLQVRHCPPAARFADRFGIVDRRVAALVAPVTTVRLARALREQVPLGGPATYVFPVLGRYSVYDSFGAPRAGVSWHHGDDLFAPRGTPVLAIANGALFSVGWQRLGGRRLWLRDEAGNEFYYAHLEDYAPLAVNGRLVRKGEVLGYVGTTGDAERTPPHLHFEIHPAPLLHLGYDGAIDPTTDLRRWRQLRTPPPASGPARLPLAVTPCVLASEQLFVG